MFYLFQGARFAFLSSGVLHIVYVFKMFLNSLVWLCIGANLVKYFCIDVSYNSGIDCDCFIF